MGVEDVIARGWIHLVHRLDGPLHLRFIIQPVMAIFLAIRAGIRDARIDQRRASRKLAAMLRRERWRERLRQAWLGVGKVFLVALAVDVVYQVWIQRGIFLFELLVTATLLALVPYALVRGPAERVAHLFLRRRGLALASK